MHSKDDSHLPSPTILPIGEVGSTQVQKETLSDSLLKALKRLPEDPSRYFNLVESEYEFIPVASLVFAHVNPKSILNANNLMVAAYEGRTGKRAPISVNCINTTFYIIDGNSTAANAIFSNWTSLPAKISR